MPQYATKGTPDFREFLKHLEENNEIEYFQDISGIKAGRLASDYCKKSGKAICIEGKPNSYLNIYASQDRLEAAIGMSFQKASSKAYQYIKSPSDRAIKFKESPIYRELPGLNELPLMKYHDGDVSGSINFATTISRSDDQYNCGIYRIQPISDRRAIMHCYPSSSLGRMIAQSDKDIPLTIAIGHEASLLLSAGVKLPPETDGLKLASHLTNIEFITGHYHPAPSAEVIINAHVSATESADEGPFFIYTGGYSKVEKFPLLTIDSIYARENFSYLSTVTGIPPMENAYLGQLCGLIHSHRVKERFPEVTDITMPIDKVFWQKAIFKTKGDSEELREFLKEDYYYKSFEELTLLKEE